MPVVEGREYRAISIDNFRALPSEDGSYIVEGYATTFDDPYAFGPDGLRECIRHTALDEADMSDVIMQYDHQGMVMARQRNGSLAIMRDEHGLFIRADLRGSAAGRELYEAIQNGLIDRMSWAFIVADDGWEYDPVERIAYITKITKVFDVSAVSLPANEGTEIKARSYIDGVIEKEQQELLQREKEKDMDARRRIALSLSLTR